MDRRGCGSKLGPMLQNFFCNQRQQNPLNEGKTLTVYSYLGIARHVRTICTMYIHSAVSPLRALMLSIINIFLGQLGVCFTFCAKLWLNVMSDSRLKKGTDIFFNRSIQWQRKEDICVFELQWNETFAIVYLSTLR